MANLAIKGHKERGKEVIGILEMLGGVNSSHLSGSEEAWCYFIDENNEIDKTGDIGNIVYSIGHFLEKFPYKIGDKVLYHECKGEIISMKWGEDDVVYTVLCKGTKWETTLNFLQPDTEQSYLNQKAEKGKEEIKEDLKGVEKFMEGKTTVTFEYIINENKECQLVIPDNIEMELRFGKFLVRNKKPQYPKTYEECCRELLLKPERATYSVCGLEYKRHLIVSLQRLLICRDAYWKIAGEQMGLGEPWEPDCINNNETKFCIGVSENEIIKLYIGFAQYILAFPTEEMRDTFYENFNDLIEQCKELL